MFFICGNAIFIFHTELFIWQRFSEQQKPILISNTIFLSREEYSKAIYCFVYIFFSFLSSRGWNNAEIVERELILEDYTHWCGDEVMPILKCDCVKMNTLALFDTCNRYGRPFCILNEVIIMLISACHWRFHFQIVWETLGPFHCDNRALCNNMELNDWYFGIE